MRLASAFSHLQVLLAMVQASFYYVGLIILPDNRENRLPELMKMFIKWRHVDVIF